MMTRSREGEYREAASQMPVGFARLQRLARYFS